MTKHKVGDVTSLRSFWTFVRRFLYYCYVLRALLGAQFAILILLGVAFGRWEGIPIAQGIYFSFITSTTVGYGDITPKTGMGQCISVVMAFSGEILFGLIVAVATQAFTVTIKEYLHSDGHSPSES